MEALTIKTKICPRCTEEKRVGEFGKNASRSDGLSHYCRLCHRRAVAENRARGIAGEPLRSRPPPKPKREYTRTFKATRSNFRSSIRRKYGITVADFDRLLIDQSGRCVGCLLPMLRPYVDHDHETDAVRGLLCMWCNSALGQAMDDPEVLRRLAEYLEATAL